MGTWTGSGGGLGTFNWTQRCFSFDATSPTATSGCRLGFYGSTASGQAWCDDLSVRALNKPF